MSLQSQLFQGDSKLQAAAVSDPAHILLGAAGAHVLKIQSALIVLDNAIIDEGELQRSFYGPSTAVSVMAYKKKRNIINRSYQTQADDIVGKMTIASLDQEMLAKEKSQRSRLCNRGENRYVNRNTIPPL
jgi:peptidoglycan hydrolase-like protein with peptidoglycan-binding domain